MECIIYKWGISYQYVLFSFHIYHFLFQILTWQRIDQLKHSFVAFILAFSAMCKFTNSHFFRWISPPLILVNLESTQGRIRGNLSCEKTITKLSKKMFFKCARWLVPVLVVVIWAAIMIAIVAIREKEIALIGLRKTNSQSFLENNLNNVIHEF